jgi:hypothetical protein
MQFKKSTNIAIIVINFARNIPAMQSSEKSSFTKKVMNEQIGTRGANNYTKSVN